MSVPPYEASQDCCLQCVPVLQSDTAQLRWLYIDLTFVRVTQGNALRDVLLQRRLQSDKALIRNFLKSDFAAIATTIEAKHIHF